MIEADRDRTRAVSLSRKRFVNNYRYGAAHRRRKRALRPLVASGLAICARCHLPIHPKDDWDLGHVDGSATEHSGPEHARCNRGAPHRNVTSREW